MVMVMRVEPGEGNWTRRSLRGGGGLGGVGGRVVGAGVGVGEGGVGGMAATCCRHLAASSRSLAWDRDRWAWRRWVLADPMPGGDCRGGHADGAARPPLLLWRPPFQPSLYLLPPPPYPEP